MSDGSMTELYLHYDVYLRHRFDLEISSDVLTSDPVTLKTTVTTTIFACDADLWNVILTGVVPWSVIGIDGEKISEIVEIFSFWNDLEI